MDKIQLTQKPVAMAEMLIRKPASEVFQAFIDPAITTKFWFTKSSGPLEEGKKVTWTWEMYDISAVYSVLKIEQDRSIVGEWPYGDIMTHLEFKFTPCQDGTFVSVINSGFDGDGDKIVANALDSKGGFTWVLAGLKAYLEYGVQLHLVADAFPKDVKAH